jgi:hypothetical protein
MPEDAGWEEHGLAPFRWTAGRGLSDVAHQLRLPEPDVREAFVHDAAEGSIHYTRYRNP